MQTTVTLHTARNFILAHLQKMVSTGKYGEPIMLHSSPGVGKSATIFQAASKVKDAFEETFNAKFKVWDVRVGAQQESDIQGIPFPTDVERVPGVVTKDMAFSTPAWYPKEGECGILLLDELSNAPIPNQQACYRTVHDRSIHNGTELPPGVIVIAAGNTKQDKTGAKGIIPALARRFMTHLFIQPTAEEFVQYAMERGIHPMVTAYLSFDKSKLIGKALDGEYGFACPANWESISGILKNEYLAGNESGDDATGVDLYEIGIIGGLGSSVGIEFNGYRRNGKYYPDFDKVERTGEYELPNDDNFDRGAMWAVLMATVDRLIGNLTPPPKGEIPVDMLEKANNLTAIFRELDVSTAGIAFRTMRTSNREILSMILRESKLSDLSEMMMNVVNRADSMMK